MVFERSAVFLKTDLVEITNAMALVEKLCGVRCRWSQVADGPIGKELALAVDDPQIGFIAQEVAKVVPEAVTTPKAGSSDPYVLQEPKLIPVLVEALKEQQQEINHLRTEVEALKAPK